MFLQINNLEKFYGEKDNRVQVLKGLSTGIEKGEICVLLGPSGSGKSTLLNIIGGIESYDKGEIIINGAAMSAMNEKQTTLYRREHLGYVFQFYNLIPNLTVKENIEVGAYLGSNPLDVDDLLHTLGLQILPQLRYSLQMLSPCLRQIRPTHHYHLYNPLVQNQ